MSDIWLPGFAGGTLDRADHIRTNADSALAAFSSSPARMILLDGLDPVVGDSGKLAVAPLPPGAMPQDYILLGVDDVGPVFAQLDDTVPHGAAYAPAVWARAALLEPSELALFGTARSLIDWHKRHGFCASCGNPTHPQKAGWGRKCIACAAEHFPRVDPVTIMLAEHDGKILLGRQHRFPPGRYSALAGFVEPGETIEEAVARELWEEAGIRVRNVRYAMSQPWPFPSTLMIACIATADDATLTLDETEIEHAIWVDADGVRAALALDPAAPFIAPPELAVAHSLLRYWLESVG